jgi:hypothetical protein
LNPIGGGSTVDILPPLAAFGDPAEIRWGVPATLGGSKSGYEFDARDTEFTEQAFQAFQLGDFTHFNQPIFAPAISGVQLEIMANLQARTGGAGDFAPLGDNNGDFLFTYDISHNETVNNADPCDSSEPDPDAAVNVNGCADEVTFAVNPFSDSFVVDGEILTLNIFGFTDSNGVTSDSFLSKERGDNTRFLAAAFEAFPTPPVQEEIPLPAGVALLPLGLAGIAALRARRRREQG